MVIVNDSKTEGKTKICPNCGAENSFTKEQLNDPTTEYYCNVCGWSLNREA